MKIFIDTADVNQIKEALAWGIIDGVTTNPSHVSKIGQPADKVFRDICALVTDAPVSLETIGLTAPEIIAEGKELIKYGKNVVVKVVNTPEGLKAVKALSSEGIKTNVTVTFSPTQALLAAKAGASYISPFVGRLDMFGHFGMDLVRQIKAIYGNYGYKTEIIVAAVRHQTHILESALCGADICTMAYDVIAQMFEHPFTGIGIQNFLNDWKKVPVK